MRVRYTPRALADLEAIDRYLHERNPRAAQEVIATIRRRIEHLAEWPRQAPTTNEPDIHVLFVGRYPYKVFYEVEKETVVIHHVRHAARRPWLGR
ncbi:MAG TPA: type II toxin-antitoxin system RelE/ParE family toxin [Beijerinckiaceae bacterium]|jgi:addiction module RelE/StbE family toxin